MNQEKYQQIVRDKGALFVLFSFVASTCDTLKRLRNSGILYVLFLVFLLSLCFVFNKKDKPIFNVYIEDTFLGQGLRIVNISESQAGFTINRVEINGQETIPMVLGGASNIHLNIGDQSPVYIRNVDKNLKNLSAIVVTYKIITDVGSFEGKTD